jgi:hypothetical protein
MVSRIAALSVLVLASVGASSAAGCGGLGVSSSAAFASGTDSNGGATGEDGGAAPPSSLGGSSSGGSADAGTTRPTYKSNPLCAVGYQGTCDPQSDNSVDCLSLLDAGAAAEDAASPDASATPAPHYACHVARDPNGGVAPVCMPEGNQTGVCTQSAQCMAGHECVGDGSNVDAQCRRYCCKSDACDVTSFCDVQPIVGLTGTMVPVCMPVATCELLSVGPTQCPGQQCGIALDGKDLEIKTCLDIGPRGVGDDCETDHCAKDLTCLGAPGARKCFALCDTSKGTTHGCPMGQSCQSSGTTFKGGSVGICTN